MATVALLDTYIADTATHKFKALVTAIESGRVDELGMTTDYWKYGNIFDTLIDYLRLIDRAPASEVVELMLAMEEKTIKKIDDEYKGAWFDDFGWWSNAIARALHFQLFPDHQTQLQNLLDTCWNHFVDNAPYVWARADHQKYSDQFAPAFEGGVWNAYWVGTSEKFEGPKNGIPSQGLTGIQNTVTNLQFLMAALRLTDRDEKTKQAADNATAFLFNWLTEQPSDPDRALWWHPLDGDVDRALIRERVSHFRHNQPDTSFRDDWAWTGDQGLMLGVLGLLMARNDAHQADYRRRAGELLRGVQHRLVDQEGLRNYTKSGISPGSDKDYNTGIGVWWRNTLALWETDPEMKTQLSTPEFLQFVKHNASVAAKSDRSHDVGYILSNHLTNDLSTLLMAAVMPT